MILIKPCLILWICVPVQLCYWALQWLFWIAVSTISHIPFCTTVRPKRGDSSQNATNQDSLVIHWFMLNTSSAPQRISDYSRISSWSTSVVLLYCSTIKSILFLTANRCYSTVCMLMWLFCIDKRYILVFLYLVDNMVKPYFWLQPILYPMYSTAFSASPWPWDASAEDPVKNQHTLHSRIVPKEQQRCSNRKFSNIWISVEVLMMCQAWTSESWVSP